MGVAYEGECESKAALAAFEAACVGKESCTVRHTEDFCVAAGCNSGVLTVQAVCRPSWPRTPSSASRRPPLSPSAPPAPPGPRRQKLARPCRRGRRRRHARAGEDAAVDAAAWDTAISVWPSAKIRAPARDGRGRRRARGRGGRGRRRAGLSLLRLVHGSGPAHVVDYHFNGQRPRRASPLSHSTKPCLLCVAYHAAHTPSPAQHQTSSARKKAPAAAPFTPVAHGKGHVRM
ncbi:hypothetical protein ACQ4PT_053919 [Festuca glaucescens]